MGLIKTSLYNGIAVSVKIATAILLNKILASYVGPAGYAVLGQFQNGLALTLSLAGGILAAGITKGTAEHFGNEIWQRAIWQTAVKLVLAASVIMSCAILFTAPWLSLALLNRTDMGSIFIWAALALPAIGANNVLLAIVNGKKETGAYVTANILGSFITLFVVGYFTYVWGLYGALLGLAISPAILLLGSGAIVSRLDWFNTRLLWGPLHKNVLKELLGYGLMGLTSALIVPLSHILIRNHLYQSFDLSAAGYWQASWKISEIYLMIVISTLSVYYLPRLAEIKKYSELKKEILSVYIIVLPIVIVGALLIYNLRDFIIATLFSKEFLPMRELFFWQLTGDVLKIGSWVLSFIMVARAMFSFFIITEIIFSLSFYLLSILFVKHQGIEGVSIAYAINYFFYWISMIFIFFRLKSSMDK